MTSKLVQKRFLKGSRVFEIVGDFVYVRLKSPFKEEKLTLGLSTIDPEPVVTESELEFHGRARTGPLLSLLRDNPNAEEFIAFVSTLKQRVLEEYSAFAGHDASDPAPAPGGNLHDVPPEFEESHRPSSSKEPIDIDVARLDHAIRELQSYLLAEDAKPFLAALAALKAEPENESCFEEVVRTFNDLGFTQGAVLTYAPYIGILLSDHPAGIIDDFFNGSKQG